MNVNNVKCLKHWKCLDIGLKQLHPRMTLICPPDLGWGTFVGFISGPKGWTWDVLWS
jgi:hypothetical protein